jgi:hypothetical protein
MFPDLCKFAMRTRIATAMQHMPYGGLFPYSLASQESL